MTYPDALRYLESFINYEKLDSYDYNRSFKLERMKRLAALFGNPHERIRSIHVAGTKGKGSTAAFIQAILKASSYKVGLYTSPHLVSFRERIRINDDLIPEDDIARILAGMKPVLDMFPAHDMPTFFEVYTLLAYLYFKENRIDFAVYETGLGGRLDATNIITPLACAITPISYEHTQKLGHTLTEIATEKCGIIKRGVPCVSAPQEREALDVIEESCAERRARLVVVGRDILFEEVRCDAQGVVFNVHGRCGEYPNLVSHLLGSHQMVNAATAIGIAESLRSRDIVIAPDAIRSGIEEARWDGRLEIVKEHPYVVLDGAQNRASARTLALALKKIFPSKRIVSVLGVSKDKDIVGILDELAPISDSFVLTKAKIAERALDPSSIKNSMDRIETAQCKEAVVTETVAQALDQALKKATDDTVVLVTGSLFVVGEARAYITDDRRCKNTDDHRCDLC